MTDFSTDQDDTILTTESECDAPAVNLFRDDIRVTSQGKIRVTSQGQIRIINNPYLLGAKPVLVSTDQDDSLLTTEA